MTNDTPVVVGDRLEVVPEELVAGGSALARLHGFPIFVRQIYPGDRALVEIEEVRKGFGRARVVEILERGPLRKSEPCPIAETCGGCDWTALRLDHQLVAKRRILTESLRRVGKFQEIPPIRIHASPLNYRMRSRLHMDGGLFGFFAERTNEVVQLVPECEVIGPNTRAALFDEGNLSAQLPDEGSIDALEVPGELVLATSGEGAPAEIAVRGFRFHIATDAFFQVNRHLLPALIDLVTAHAMSCQGRERALDLYSGVGFFSLPLAALFSRVVAVESSPVSYGLAKINARHEPDLEVVRGDAARFLRNVDGQFDFIFADPPRAGLAPEVTEAVAGASREKICYLSCDPVTFSRDAARLARRGWSPASLDLIDLFPNTHHIETLSSFVRAT